MARAWFGGGGRGGVRADTFANINKKAADKANKETGECLRSSIASIMLVCVCCALSLALSLGGYEVTPGGFNVYLQYTASEAGCLCSTPQPHLMIHKSFI